MFLAYRHVIYLLSKLDFIKFIQFIFEFFEQNLKIFWDFQFWVIKSYYQGYFRVILGVTSKVTSYYFLKSQVMGYSPKVTSNFRVTYL